MLPYQVNVLFGHVLIGSDGSNTQWEPGNVCHVTMEDG